jgi:hypothetical protein
MSQQEPSAQTLASTAYWIAAVRALMQPFIQGCGPWQPYFRDHVAQAG